MTFKEASAKKRKWLKEHRKIEKQLEKSYRKKARIKAKICNKIGCTDCIFRKTDKCVEFVKDGDFSALLNWAKGKRADSEAEEKQI